MLLLRIIGLLLAWALGRRPVRRRRRRSGWVEPERIHGLAAQDRARGRSRFYVYVLDTRYGCYVGHSYHVGRRYAAHRRGDVLSTAGSEPRLAWVSRAFTTRGDAARFEAALKSLNQSRSPRFHDITGVAPTPFFPL